MALPRMEWNGNTTDTAGEALFMVGEFRMAVQLKSCGEALTIQRVIDNAYRNGGQDANRDMRRMIEATINECGEKW